MVRTSVIIIALAAAPAFSSASAQTLIPRKDVRLTCSSLPYVFDCSIPLTQNPQFGSRCFYVAGGQSTLMRADHRMGFSNGIVSLQVNAGLNVTGVVTETQTGNQSQCEQEDD
jgi:hypothetical protein